MKSLLLLLLSFFMFNSFSMQRLGRLAALPVENEGELISFDQLPNPTEPAPLMPLRLWQKPQDKARLELPLVEAKIRSLEKNYDKEKKTFNEKREKTLDHLLYAAGYAGIVYALHKLAYENSFGLEYDIFHQLNKFFSGRSWMPAPQSEAQLGTAISFCNLAICLPTILAAKNTVQILWKSPKLFGGPKESIQLLAARQERDQLLLTLDQADQS